MKGFRYALSFLTRLPSGLHAQEPSELARAVAWFPTVGALVGAIVAASYALGIEVWPSFVAAAVAVAIGLFVTGAFHEDGLADTIDAFGGGRTAEARLRIMKDPTHGTFGVLALAIPAIVRIGTIGTFDATAAFAALIAIHALSRAASVVLMGWVVPAGGDGLGAAYAGGVTRGRVAAAVSSAVILGIIGLQEAVVPAVALCAASVIGWGWLTRWAVGGITGDVLGATQQVTEVALLLLVVALR